MKYILGNWKMNGLLQDSIELAKKISVAEINDNTKVAIFPPFTYLSAISSIIASSRISLGAQDVSAEKEGAYTGDISAKMIKNCGCRYVLVGHSERRINHQESNELVKNKAIMAIAEGLKPVICVGENLRERESGNYLKIITEQVKNSLPSLAHSDDYIIAYEPVWAIGSGKTPTEAEISEVHKTIASILYHDTSMLQNSSVLTSIVYGGSVKSSNAKSILASEYVDGVLVGGASLDGEEFMKIVASS